MGSNPPAMAGQKAAADDFYDNSSFGKRSNWIIGAFAIITLGVLALPFIWAFTGWL
jgi:hypothetical protein